MAPPTELKHIHQKRKLADLVHTTVEKRQMWAMMRFAFMGRSCAGALIDTLEVGKRRAVRGNTLDL